jgi:hypothetical protein
MKDLDSFGEKVSSLGVVCRVDGCSTQLASNIKTGCPGLQEKAGDTEHGQAAMLEFLKLLLFVLLRGIIEVVWVVSSLSKVEVARNAVFSLLLDKLEPVDFHASHGDQDLDKSNTRDLVKGLEGVGVVVGISSSPVVTGEGSESSGPDESEDCQLGDTSVGDFGLTEVLEAVRAAVPIRGSNSTRVSKWVETNISDHGSVQTVRGSSPWKGLAGTGSQLGHRRLLCRRGREGSGRADEEGGDGSDLHGSG